MPKNTGKKKSRVDRNLIQAGKKHYPNANTNPNVEVRLFIGMQLSACVAECKSACLGLRENIAANIELLCIAFEIQQQQQQLVSLQQHKQQLEKHKKELEDLSVWSLFPKFLPKPSESYWVPNASLMPPFPLALGAAVTPINAPINLAQQKKQGGATSKQERAIPMTVSQPVQQHVMQVS